MALQCDPAKRESGDRVRNNLSCKSVCSHELSVFCFDGISVFVSEIKMVRFARNVQRISHASPTADCFALDLYDTIIYTRHTCENILKENTDNQNKDHRFHRVCDMDVRTLTALLHKFTRRNTNTNTESAF